LGNQICCKKIIKSESLIVLCLALSSSEGHGASGLNLSSHCSVSGLERQQRGAWSRRWCKRDGASDGASFHYMRAQGRAGQDRAGQGKARQGMAWQGNRTGQASGALEDQHAQKNSGEQWRMCSWTESTKSKTRQKWPHCTRLPTPLSPLLPPPPQRHP